MTRLAGGRWQAARVALVGLGAAGPDSEARLRTAAARTLGAARQQRAQAVAFLLRGGVEPERAARAITEGVLLGSFEDRRFKTDDDEDAAPRVQRCDIVCPGAALAAVEQAVEVGRTLGEASNRARELANAPGNMLTPRDFADQARALLADSGVAVEVLDETAVERLGMGLLLGVARGSTEPPRLIVMRHEPPDAPAAPVLGLVGKGVTFDSGGISLKPADGMEWMRSDMAGGAAVVWRDAGDWRPRGLRTRVIGIVPATENMPGGRATKPGGRPGGRQRHDGGGHQYRCGGPSHSRRRAVVRARARRDPSGRRGDADRRLRRRPGQGRERPVRPVRRSQSGWAPCSGPRDERGNGSGRCRSTRSTGSSCAPKRRT